MYIFVSRRPVHYLLVIIFVDFATVAKDFQKTNGIEMFFFFSDVAIAGTFTFGGRKLIS